MSKPLATREEVLERWKFWSTVQKHEGDLRDHFEELDDGRAAFDIVRYCAGYDLVAIRDGLVTILVALITTTPKGSLHSYIELAAAVLRSETQLGRSTGKNFEESFATARRCAADVVEHAETDGQAVLARSTLAALDAYLACSKAVAHGRGWSPEHDEFWSNVETIVAHAHEQIGPRFASIVCVLWPAWRWPNKAWKRTDVPRGRWLFDGEPHIRKPELASDWVSLALAMGVDRERIHDSIDSVIDAVERVRAPAPRSHARRELARARELNRIARTTDVDAYAAIYPGMGSQNVEDLTPVGLYHAVFAFLPPKSKRRDEDFDPADRRLDQLAVPIFRAHLPEVAEEMERHVAFRAKQDAETAELERRKARAAALRAQADAVEKGEAPIEEQQDDRSGERRVA